MTTAFRTMAVTALAAFLALFAAASACAAAPADVQDRFAIGPDFSSGVPLLLLDFGSSGAKDPGDLSGERITASLIANASGPNRLDGKPALTVALRSMRDETRSGAKKSSYLLSLSATGQPGNAAIPGLPPASVWSLRGSDRDKLMLRNYLGAAMGAKMLPGFAPRALLCEVVTKRGGTFAYQGVYLLSEQVSGGVCFSSGALGGTTDIALPAAVAGGLAYTAVPAPGLAAGSRPQDFAQTEAGLYSDDSALYFDALDSLDTESFIDTYLLYNWLLNYSRERLPFYLYRKSDGRIAASPLWSFEDALDNTVKPLDVPAVRDDFYPWFNRLLLSSAFNEALQTRFFQLAREDLSNAALEELVESAADSLGPAFSRDWARWQSAYDAVPLENYGGENVQEIIRHTATPMQELVKIKFLLRENSLAFKQYMETLRWKEVLFTENKREYRVTVKTLAFVATFFVLVSVARRRM